MVRWQASNDDCYLFHNNDPRPVARLRRSSEFPDLWQIVAPRVLAGEHDIGAARSFAERLAARRPAGAA